MEFYVFLIIFIHLPCMIHSVQSAQGETCTQDNNITLACNYIPKDIPKGITKFRMELETSLILDSFTFTEENWRELEYLEFTEKRNSRLNLVFKDNCLKQLKSLNELHIHVSRPDVLGGSFSRLDSVKTLDFSGCGQFTIEEFKLAINGSNILPALNKIILSNWNYYGGSYNYDDELIDSLQRRKIIELDLSISQISYINFTHLCKKLTNLKVLNVSYAIISDFKDTRLTQQDSKHIKMFDISHAVLPKKIINVPPGKLVLHDATTNFSEWHSVKDIRALLGSDSINISGLIPHVTTIWLHNVTIFIDIDHSFETTSITGRQNNLKRMDVKMICDIYYFGAIETLDISDNAMEFLHPSFLSCFKNLINLDLSKNDLHEMVEENISLFECLFSGLNFLKFIRMQANGLHKIPTKLFEKHKSIEEIDLSRNSLKQVTFYLGNLNNLKVLDLSGNKIHSLDSSSIHFLNSLSTGSNDSIILESNPITCTACEAKTFIMWLTSTSLVRTNSKGLTCLDESGKYIIISDKTVDLVQKICQRKVVRTAVGVYIAGGAVVLTIFCMLIINWKQKQIRKNRKRSNVINNLQEGEGEYRFAVFLSYCNKDEDFVTRHVLDQLDENLQLMTGVNRSLVCTGDRNFRPGFNNREETFRLLDSATVFIVIITNNYLTSNFCKLELETAYENKTPIVLMFIEQVDCTLMNRTIKWLFQNKTRILWTVDENGVYRPKTTWENVCTSVLDLIKENN